MEIINVILGVPLGYLMRFCYMLVENYGVSIIVFTLLTKILMFPLSLISQKNSIIMVKINPLIEDIKQRYAGNNTLIIEEQKALYKREKYSTIKGMLPLLLQIPIILGLINVVYNPLQHLLHLDAQAIQLLIAQASQVLGTPLEGLSAQIGVMDAVRLNPEAFAGMAGITEILNVNISFLGLSMTQIPTLLSISVLYPILSGVSALVLGLYQNKYNVLQRSQGAIGKWGMTIFLMAFSAYFAYVLPCGLGLYWITGNILSIPVLYICNKIYDPRKYVDMDSKTEKPKLTRAEKAQERVIKKAHKAREKADKKRFSAYQNKQIVFYSESNGFYKYFKGFIEYITQNSDVVIHYVTSDYNDKIFENENPQIKAYYIGPIALIQFMMLIDADMVVMTMPDLEQYHIKRSLVRKDIEYVYIDHAMASLHLMYRKGALDHFDTIFCYGPNYIAEIREMERVYDLPAKRLIKTGYALLDTLLESVEKQGDIHNNPKVILIAPSWQNDNLLELCLDDLLTPLFDKGYKIILRPHPEFVKRFPSKMKAITEKYQDKIGEGFVIEADFSSNTSIYSSDLIITDWSGIAQEFSYATKKPSLFINTPMKVMNPEYKKIPLKPLDISLRDEIGVSVDVDKLSSLPQVIDELFLNKELYAKKITEVLNKNIYDIGKGSIAGGQYLVSQLAEIKRLREQADNEPEAGIETDNNLQKTSPYAEELCAAMQEISKNPQDYMKAMEQVLANQADTQSLNCTKGEYLIEIVNEIKQLREKDGVLGNEN